MDCLQGLGDEEVEPYIRACSLQLQLANIAEERERIRRRREYDASGDQQRESLAETAELLAQAGVNAAEALRSLHVELVLTAHPTEATRRSVLDHQADLMDLLDRLDDPRSGQARRRAVLEEIQEILTIWWQTDEVRRARPRVDDEVRRNLFVFESTLFDAVPEVLGEVERAFGDARRGAGAGVRLVGGLGHGRPSRGGGRDAGAHAAAAPAHRGAAAARPRALAGAALLARAAAGGRHAGAGAVAGARRARAALGARAAPHAPAVGAAAGQARVRRAPAREHAARRPAASPATRTRRSCGATSRSCASASAPSTSPAARSGGCCGRSTSSGSISRASTCASRRASCARRRARCCPGSRAPATSRRGSRCSRRRSRARARGSSGRPTDRPGSSCACSTRSRWRATRTAAAPCRRW